MLRKGSGAGWPTGQSLARRWPAPCAATGIGYVFFERLARLASHSDMWANVHTEATGSVRTPYQWNGGLCFVPLSDRLRACSALGLGPKLVARCSY